MSEAALTEPLVTVETFEAFLDGQSDASLWELVAGRIVAMTNPSETHEQIAANIAAPLKLAIDPKGCRVYQGDIGVQRSDLTHHDDALLLDALAFTITLDRVYFGVEPTNVHRLAR